jgi:DNA-binding transcriptional ArsR family regulator
MANQSPALDQVFLALGDPTRRAVVHRLGSGAATVSELAAPFKMALPSFMKHLGVLERSGLVRTHKTGRVRSCELQPTVLRSAERWIEAQRTLWEAHADRMVQYVESLHQQEQHRGR